MLTILCHLPQLHYIGLYLAALGLVYPLWFFSSLTYSLHPSNPIYLPNHHSFAPMARRIIDSYSYVLFLFLYVHTQILLYHIILQNIQGCYQATREQKFIVVPYHPFSNDFRASSYSATSFMRVNSQVYERVNHCVNTISALCKCTNLNVFLWQLWC